MMSHSLLSLVVVAAILQGAAAACNPAVAEEADGDCVCHEALLLYNYRDHTCVEEKDIFAFDGCGPYASNATGACECDEGFANSTSGLCEDADTCPLTTCGPREVCYNNFGPETCKCIDYYRRSSTGACVALDETRNPHWNDCPQNPYNTPDGFVCFCYDTTIYDDTDGDGRNCLLKSGYENCMEVDPGMVCVKDMTTGDVTTFYKQGFTNVNETAVDKNECEESDDTQCWPNSHCVNLEDGLGYDCVCDDGYTDDIFPNTGTNIMECVPLRCNQGEGYDCIDPCAKMTCKEDEICVEQSPNIGTCVEKLGIAIFSSSNQLPGNLFTAYLEAASDELTPTRLTASLEVAFGEHAVQASRSALKMNGFEVEIIAAMNETDVMKRLQDYCISRSPNLSDYCEMPQGVVVNSSFPVNPKGVCDANPCPDTHTCDPATRTCKCKEYETAEYINFYQVCNTSEALRSELDESLRASDDLQQQLDDQKTTSEALRSELDGILRDRDTSVAWLQQQLNDAIEAQKVIGGVLGALLGLALVLIVVLVFFKK